MGRDMKIWVDDIREMPQDYDCWARDTEFAIEMIGKYGDSIEEISLDHDAGNEHVHGGDFIKILEWMEYEEEVNGKNFKFTIHIHSANPVGRAAMRRIIEKRGWKYGY